MASEDKCCYRSIIFNSGIISDVHVSTIYIIIITIIINIITIITVIVIINNTISSNMIGSFNTPFYLKLTAKLFIDHKNHNLSSWFSVQSAIRK